MLSLLFPVLVFAAGYQPLAPVPDLTSFEAKSAPTDLGSYLQDLYKFLVGAAAALAVIMVIWGGVEYMTTDAIGHHEEGKQKIQNAVLGLLLALSSYIILKTVNADLLKLDFAPELEKVQNTEPIEVKPIPSAGTTNTQNQNTD
jgi:type IV secretory pathway VirB2 component (pilin)